MCKFLLIYKHTQNNEYILKGLFMLEQWQEDNDIKEYSTFEDTVNANQ